VEIVGAPAAGHSTGQAMQALQKIVDALPAGYASDWIGQSYQEVLAGNSATMLMVLSIVVVFLCLAALYESWSVPVAVLLAVPLGLLGMAAFGHLFHVSNDIYFKISMVTVIGLAAKNAILIVEFANQLREEGMEAVEAVAHAAATRLRPILMTSIAFILGIIPLAFAHGDGAQSRISLGTAVLGGMLLSTIMNLAIVPVLYIVVIELTERKKRKRPTQPSDLPPPPMAPPPLPDGGASATAL
jgi:multidrug efflux pump